MANPAAFASGSQALTVTTEHFVSSPNTVGTFTFHVDLQPMVAGDVIELRAYQMVLTAGTQRVVFFHAFYGAQPVDDLIAVSIPIGNELTDTNSLRFSIKQTFGTTRTVVWKVLQWT